MSTYAKHFKPVPVPPVSVSQPLSGKSMVKNADGGGYAFKIGDWQRLQRFLMLGSEGGSYYEGEKKLTLANAQVVLRCLAEDHARVLGEIYTVSHKGLAPSNSSAIFALALACLNGSEAERRQAWQTLDKVCRIGTHLFEFMDVYFTIKGRKSLGRMARHFIGAWYTNKSEKDLAYGLVKYQQREGWSNRDVLRLSHPKSDDQRSSFLLRWAVGKDDVKLYPISQVDFAPEVRQNDGLVFLAAYHEAQSADKQTVIQLIRDYNLPREALPTQWLNDKDVWVALLDKMPYTAMLRNLPKMTELGMFAPFEKSKSTVVARLMDANAIAKARVHPLVLLQALKTYQSEVSVRGSKTWTANSDIVSALDAAFYLSFDNVDALDKNILIAIDSSASMMYPVAGMVGLSAREAGLAMALVYKKQNPDAHIVAFSTSLSEVPWLHVGQRLDDAMYQFTRHVDASATNLNLPFEYATKRGWDVDGVLMITDGEGNMGGHAAIAKDILERQLGHAVRWFLAQTTASMTSTQDPTDSNSFEYAGFGSNIVTIANEFFKGNL